MTEPHEYQQHQAPPAAAPPAAISAAALATLADVLAAQKVLPSVRVGRIATVNVTGSTWTADVTVEGGAGVRRCRWLGSGARPVVGDLVTYINESPVPTILGRVASNNESQNFGGGTLSVGDVTDAQGSFRGGINTATTNAATASSAAASASTSASNAQGTANDANWNAGNAQGSANYAINQANYAISLANNAQGTANYALDRANNANDQIWVLQNQINNILQRLTAIGA